MTNYHDLIREEGAHAIPDFDFQKLKPALVDFIVGCMQRCEKTGPFSEKIRAMRQNQTKFFLHRNKEYLDKSKELEREVDLFLKPQRPAPQQGGLF